MRALQLVGFGKVAEFRDVAEPEPGPGEVVVRIGGAGACHSDLHLMHDFTEGMLPWTPPFTIGHENAGWIEAVGAGVVDLEVGAPVAVYGPWGCGRCQRCRQGMENYCERQAVIGAYGGGLGRRRRDGALHEGARASRPAARHARTRRCRAAHRRRPHAVPRDQAIARTPRSGLVHGRDRRRRARAHGAADPGRVCADDRDRGRPRPVGARARRRGGSEPRGGERSGRRGRDPRPHAWARRRLRARPRRQRRHTRARRLGRASARSRDARGARRWLAPGRLLLAGVRGVGRQHVLGFAPGAG